LGEQEFDHQDSIYETKECMDYSSTASTRHILSRFASITCRTVPTCKTIPPSTYAISTWYYYSSSTLLFSRHEECPSRCTVEVWVLRLYDRLTNLVISPQARTSLCRVGCRRIIRIVGRWSLCLLAVYCFLQLDSLLCSRAEAFLRTRTVVIVLGD
jgi:hypothetical protein